MHVSFLKVYVTKVIVDVILINITELFISFL